VLSGYLAVNPHQPANLLQYIVTDLSVCTAKRLSSPRASAEKFPRLGGEGLGGNGKKTDDNDNE